MKITTYVSCILSIICAIKQPLSWHLEKAIKEGRTQDAIQFVEWGASLNYIGNSGLQPLLLAASKKNETLVKYFLAEGAPVDQRHELFNSTPLMWALYAGSYECTKLLVDAHASTIHCAPGDGNTPLHHAALYFPEAVELLLDHGAYLVINKKNKLKNTPLACLLVRGKEYEKSYEALKQLLIAGADPEIGWYEGGEFQAKIRTYLSSDIDYIPGTNDLLKLYDLGCDAWGFDVPVRTTLFATALSKEIQKYGHSRLIVGLARDIAHEKGDDRFPEELESSCSQVLYARAYLKKLLYSGK